MKVFFVISSSHCQKAQDAYREGDYDQALESINKCLAGIIRESLSKSMTSKSQQFYDAKFLEADIHLKRKDFDSADEVFESLKPTLIGDSDHISYLKAKTYYLKARIEIGRNNPLEYGDNMQLVKQHFVNAKLYEEAVDILFDLMQFHSDRISSNKISEIYEEIEELSKKIKDKDNSRLSSAKAKLEFIKINGFEDEKQARQMLNSAINDFSKSKAYHQLGEAKLELASLEEKYDFEKSEKLIEEAISHMSEDSLDITTSITLGSIKILKGEVEDGVEIINSFIDKVAEAEKTPALGRSLLNLSRSSLVHLSTSHKDLTEKIIKTSISVSEELDLRFAKAINYLIEGLFLYLSDNAEQGKSKLNMLKILYKKIEKDAAGTTGNWQYDIISFITNYEENQQLGNLLKKYNNELRSAEILFMIGLYLHHNDYIEDSRKVLSKSQDIFKKHKGRKNSIGGIVEYLKTY